MIEIATTGMIRANTFLKYICIGKSKSRLITPNLAKNRTMLTIITDQYAQVTARPNLYATKVIINIKQPIGVITSTYFLGLPVAIQPT